MGERLSMVRSKWTLFLLVVSSYIFISVHVVYRFNVFFRCYNATFLTRIQSISKGKIMTRFSFVRIKPCKLDVFSHLYTNGVNCKKNDLNSIQIKIVTLNFRGLNKSIKRRSIFRWLHKQKAHFYFLQETYSDKKLKAVWEAEWGGKIFCSHGTKHSKSVMILLNPK